MSFQCTACWDKSYDKAWKLQRHVRESKKCFERINPGMPANYFVRFQCFSCGYASPREPDLDRHRRRVHGETDNPIASGLHSTSSADASTEDDINVISDLSQPENPHDLLFPVEELQSNAEHHSPSLDGTYTCCLSTDSSTSLVLASLYSCQSITTPTTDEGSGKIERFDSHLNALSQAHNAKRDSLFHDRLSVDYKRFCADLDLVSNFSVTTPSWAPGLSTESVPAHDVHTNPSIHSSPILPSTPKCKSIVTSSSGIQQSVNSKGSLFGIPSTHSYKPWMAWSSGSATQASATKSLHSNGMPAPMLNIVDEELSLSRAWTSEERPDSYKSFHLTPQEEFGLAAADDDVERMRLLVEDLAFDCNHRDHEGRTALVWAAERGHHQAVEILLSNPCGGVDVNAQDDRGMTAIIFACHRGDLRVFYSLLNLPAIDLGIQNNAGPTAFMIAIQSSDPDSTVIVKEFVAHVQTRPDYHTTAAKWHPIFNAQDDMGLTPLHWAVKLRRHDCISVLLETGRVDVNMKALDGNTAVMHAVEELIQPYILELLFDRKACDPTLINERGETLVGVARRVVQERNIIAGYGRHNIPAYSRRLQMAKNNLSLCKAYASHYELHSGLSQCSDHWKRRRRANGLATP